MLGGCQVWTTIALDSWNRQRGRGDMVIMICVSSETLVKIISLRIAVAAGRLLEKMNVGIYGAIIGNRKFVQEGVKAPNSRQNVDNRCETSELVKQHKAFVCDPNCHAFGRVIFKYRIDLVDMSMVSRHSATNECGSHRTCIYDPVSIGITIGVGIAVSMV